MKRKYRFLDPIIATGIIFSVAVAMIMVIIGQDSALSLLCGLITTTITLMIDVIARLEESETNILKSSALGTSVSSDPSLLSSIRQIVDDYLAVKSHRYKVFSQEATQTLENCRNVLHGLIEGHMTVNPFSQFTFGRSGIDEIRDSMVTVQYATPSYWRTRHGEKYWQSNLAAMKRGVKITRIWLQNQEVLYNYRDIMELQENAGIQVLVALLDDVPHELHEDYLIADRDMLVKQELTLDGLAKAEITTVDPVEVQRALNNYDLLLRYTCNLKAFFSENTVQ